jgi:hypothetical protein
MRDRHEARSRNDRGQTGIDFLVGMSVFLLAVGFVFAFVPTMFDPFGGPGVNDALIADRSAAQLAENYLVEDPSNPGVLSLACTAAFFEENEDWAEEHCRFSDEQIDNLDDLTALFGIPEWKNVQVTIGDPDDVTYADGNGEHEIEMKRGDDSSTGSDTVSQRVVSIDGETYELRVRVW